MRDYIRGNEVCCLKNAKMEYPTWELLDKLIDRGKTSISLSLLFGNSPFSKPDKKPFPVIGTPLLKEITKGHEYFGIDVPVLLRPNVSGTEKTIVIVGESPLRDTNVFSKPDEILLGTPYAVHQAFNTPSRCNVYRKIFSDLLARGHNVYLTDIIKVWWKGKKGKEMKANEIDKDLFKNEIKIITKGKYVIGKDVFIVAWGKTAEIELNKMEDYKDIFKPMLHPGHMNWNNWKLHIFEKAVYYYGANYAKEEERYPQIGGKTTEVIVANEAVKEILEWVK